MKHTRAGAVLLAALVLAAWMPDAAMAFGLPMLAFTSSQDGGQVTLYAAPSEDGDVLGVYFSAVEVTIEDLQGDWAQVDLGEGMCGWMPTRTLDMADNSFDGVPNVPVLRLTEAAELLDGPGGQPVETYPAGTLTEAMGVLENGYVHVTVAGQSGLMADDCLEKTGIFSSLWHKKEEGIPEQGYATLALAEGESAALYAAPRTDAEQVRPIDAGVPVEVLALADGWLQARVYSGACQGFIPAQGARIYWLEEMTVTDAVSLGEGTYTAGDALPPGLYGLTVPAGEQGGIRVEGAEGAFSRAYAAQGEALLALYLPEGASVRVEGAGVLAPLTAQSMISQESGWAYEGSGRFLCGWQTQGEQTRTLNLTLREGAQGGYYRLTTLDADAGVAQEPEAVYLQPGQTHTLSNLLPGYLLEFQNLRIEAVLGNG